MKVSVLGAGAIGSMFAGLIKHRDPAVDVLLVARGEHEQAMRRQEHVRLAGPWGTYRPPVRLASDLSDIRGSEVLLLTVKSHATAEAIASVVPFLDDAVVVSIQNGINHPVLLQYVPPERLVMGMTATNMAILEPGSVSLQLDGATILGTVPGCGPTDALRQATAVLQSSGMKVLPHDNVLGVQYNKLAVNALGYASVLSASNFISEALLHKPWRRTVGIPILRESIGVFDRAGIKLARIPGVPDVRRFCRVLELLSVPVLGFAMDRVMRSLFNRKPIVFSLYQDLLRGKGTEIDLINGEIVRLATECGIQAPYSAAVVELVHQLEQRGDGSFFTREEVIEHFNRRFPAGAVGIMSGNSNQPTQSAVL